MQQRQNDDEMPEIRPKSDGCYGRFGLSWTAVIQGEDATSARGSIQVQTNEAVRAHADVDFDQTAAVGAKGTVTLNDISETRAEGTVNIVAFAGQRAIGSIAFNGNPVNGDTVTVSDGKNTPIVFTAVSQLTPGVKNEFKVEGTREATLTNFVNALNALHDADKFNVAIEQVFTAGRLSEVATLTNGYYLALGNSGKLETSNPATVKTTAWQGGKNQVGAGDQITLNDGVKSQQFTFVKVLSVPAKTGEVLLGATLNANEFHVAVTAEQQAQNFAQAVNSAGLNLDIVANAPKDSDWVTLTFKQAGAVGNGKKIIVTKATGSDTTNIWASNSFFDGKDASQNVVPGNFVVVSDGESAPVYFTAIAGDPTAGSALFKIGATAAETAQNLANAINGYTHDGVKLNLIAGRETADSESVTIVNTIPGKAGNFTDFVQSAGFYNYGMRYGQDATSLAVGDYVTLNDGAKTLTFTAVSAGTTTDFLSFVIGATKNQTAENLVAAINAQADFAIVATNLGDGEILISNENFGAIGNQEIKVHGNLGKSDMFGGSSGALNVSRDLKTAVTGYGSNIVELNGAYVGRNLVVQGASGVDEVSLNGLTVNGKATIKLGQDDDRLSIDASKFKGTFSAATGKGEDVVLIDQLGEGGTRFKMATSFNFGKGADTFVDAVETQYTTFTSGKNISVVFAGIAGEGSQVNDDGKVLGWFDSRNSPIYKNVNGPLA